MGRSVASAARTVHRDGPYPTREAYAGPPPSAHWPLLRNASSADDLAIAIVVKQTCRRDTKVSTYPYHDGTKLGYTASLPYTLRSDGSSTGDDDGAQLRDLLQKVISD